MDTPSGTSCFRCSSQDGAVFERASESSAGGAHVEADFGPWFSNILLGVLCEGMQAERVSLLQIVAKHMFLFDSLHMFAL